MAACRWGNYPGLGAFDDAPDRERARVIAEYLLHQLRESYVSDQFEAKAKRDAKKGAKGGGQHRAPWQE